MKKLGDNEENGGEDISFHSGSADPFNTFHFWNGDEYTGEFSVSEGKQKIVRTGTGVYKTSDNQIYEGIWEDDSLIKADKVVFADGSQFTGELKDMVIQQQGKYTFKENVEIEGDFIDNELVGRVYLTDPNQNKWRALVGLENFICFYPLHPFWQAVLNLPSSKEENEFLGEAASDSTAIFE